MVGQQTPGGVDNANGLFIESAAGIPRLKAAGGRASQRPYHLPHRRTCAHGLSVRCRCHGGGLPLLSGAGRSALDSRGGEQCPGSGQRPEPAGAVYPRDDRPDGPGDRSHRRMRRAAIPAGVLRPGSGAHGPGVCPRHPGHRRRRDLYERRGLRR